MAGASHVSIGAPSGGEGASRVTVADPARPFHPGELLPPVLAPKGEPPAKPTLWQTVVSVFTWWHGQTIGTRVHTARFGEFVGYDEGGNAYYQTRGGVKDPALGFVRRWVVYNGPVEASRIPPGWYGWLQHRATLPPTEEAYLARPWEKAHQPNLTGTDAAYRPQGSVTIPKGTPGEENPRVGAAYDAWSPE